MLAKIKQKLSCSKIVSQRHHHKRDQLTLIGSASQNYDSGLHRPRNDFHCTNERLAGSVLCVCCMFRFQTWTPCTGIISPSPPNVNKTTMHGPKQWRRFECSLRVLYIGILQT
jgi:hypothetical protein